MPLIVLVYEINEESMVFSHQAQIVNNLSDYFDRIYVLTKSPPTAILSSNIRVIYPFHWVSQTLLYYFWLNLMIIYLRVFKSCRTVFSHMTETSSLAIGLLGRLIGIKHVLWYAHAAVPIRLRIARYFVNYILSSTPGSCRLKSNKVIYIGQSVDNHEFKQSFKGPYSYPKRFLHIGRNDPSKNIGLIIDVFLARFENDCSSTLTLIGDSSNIRATKYQHELKAKYKEWIATERIIFRGKMPRKEIPLTAIDYDCFIHAYQGSLDKTLIEATMLGLPVVTINKEYKQEFGSWNQNSNTLSLLEELDAFLACDAAKVKNVCSIRRKKAIDKHSLGVWVLKVLNFLGDDSRA